MHLPFGAVISSMLTLKIKGNEAQHLNRSKDVDVILPSLCDVCCSQKQKKQGPSGPSSANVLINRSSNDAICNEVTPVNRRSEDHAAVQQAGPQARN